MEKLIQATSHDKDRYELYASIGAPLTGGLRELTFSSVWTGAKNPKEHERKFQTFLSEDSIQRLRELLAQ